MFKKITTLLLLTAFVAVTVIPAFAVKRTAKTEAVKTEVSKVKQSITKNYAVDLAAPAVMCTQHLMLNASEPNRPPGVSKAYITQPLKNKYMRRDKIYYSWRLCHTPGPDTRRTV